MVNAGERRYFFPLICRHAPKQARAKSGTRQISPPTPIQAPPPRCKVATLIHQYRHTQTGELAAVMRTQLRIVSAVAHPFQIISSGCCKHKHGPPAATPASNFDHAATQQ